MTEDELNNYIYQKVYQYLYYKIEQMFYKPLGIFSESFRSEISAS